MQIVVHMRPAANDSEPSVPASTAVPPELAAIATRWDLTVTAVPADAHERGAERVFVFDGVQAETAERVIADLRAVPGVRAAYLKPLDELP